MAGTSCYPNTLDIGAEFLSDSSTLSNGLAGIPKAETSIVLASVGKDLLLFLFSSVVVTLTKTNFMKSWRPRNPPSVQSRVAPTK